jgi:hypothetical protein
LKNTAANLAVLASLAKAPLVPLEVGIDISKLSNSSKLVWKAPEN